MNRVNLQHDVTPPPFIAVIFFSCFAHPAFAGGGLDNATEAVSEIQVWFYGFLSVGCLLYMGWQITLALTKKQDWMDVGLAFCKVAVAGGSVLGAQYAWSIWGS